MKKVISLIMSICVVITGLPMIVYAQDITPEISLEEFTSQLQELQAEHDNNYVSEITIENGSEFYYVDGDKKPVVNSQNEKAEATITNNDIEIPLSAIEPYCELPEFSTYSMNGNPEEITVDKETAEELGFEVDIEDDKAVLTQPYQTERLIVKSKYDINPLDSLAMIEGYNDLHIVQFDNQESAKQAEEYYNKQALIEYAEPDLVMSTMEIDHHETASTYSNSAITYDNHLSWGSESIGIDDYIDYLGDVSTLPEIVVGIIDTGIDLDHEFLKDRIIPTGVNYSDSGALNSENDDHGHGTHVAGIVADNTTENVKIKSYKALSSTGNGDLSDVCLAIDKAVSDGVNVINMSLGSKGESSTMKTAVNNAVKNGISVCVAAGNNGSDASKYVPASIDECITVAAIDAYDDFPYWTNWGTCVDIIAPGVSIYSSYFGNEYKSLNGTSMASPFVAAASAMILCKEINFTPNEICELLIDNGRDCSPPNRLKGINALYIGTITAYNGERTAIPEFSCKSGKYSDSITIEITCSDEDAEIYYTLDGFRASQNVGTLYTEPIVIDKVTSLHAVAYSPNKLKSLQAVADYYITFTDPEENFVIDSEGVIVKYLGSNNYLTIPDKIAGVTVTAIGSDVFSDSKLVMIKFPDSLTRVNDNAFLNCAQLYSVEAKNLKSIGYYAFGECESLTEIDMSQIEFIDEWGFAGCLSLPSVYNDKLTEIKAYTFYYLDSVININLPNVTVVGENGICNSTSLKSLNLPKLECVDLCGLSGLDVLEEIDLPNLTDLKRGYNFSHNTSLKTINIPKYNGELPEAVFWVCGLEEFNNNAVTGVGEGAFSDCYRIKSICLKNATHIGKDAFESCKYLEDIYIPSVTDIGYQAFREANNVEILFAPSLVSTQSLPVVNPNTKIYLSSKFIEYNETYFSEQNATIIAPKDSYAETVTVNGTGQFDNNFKFVPSDYRDKSIATPTNVTDLGRSICCSAAGVRFGFTWDNINEIESLAADIEYGFIYSQKGAENLSIDTVDNKNIKKTVANNRVDHGDTTSFNLVISNIPKDYFGREITARAYVCIDGMYFYSNILKGSFSEVAQLVLADNGIDADTKNSVKNLLEV